MKHLNAFDIVAIHLTLIDVNIGEEEQCITLLCYFIDSWDNLVMTINSTSTKLKLEKVFVTLLQKNEVEFIHGFCKGWSDCERIF